jgi:hypothetical protein
MGVTSASWTGALQTLIILRTDLPGRFLQGRLVQHHSMA